MVNFPLSRDLPSKRIDSIIDTFGWVKEVLGDLEKFELDYTWDPDTDPNITPVIVQEWDHVNKQIGNQFVSNARRVLSIGGGGSTPTHRYLSEQLDYFCVLNPSLRDLQDYREAVESNSRIILIRGVGELLPFVGESFDLIEIPATLDHCNDPSQVIKECYRVLEKGGRLVISGGNGESWYRKLVKALRIPFSDLHQHHHSIHLSPTNLESLLSNSGFRRIQISTSYFLKLPKFIEKRVTNRVIMKLHQTVSNSLLPKLFGIERGGMLIVSCDK